MRDQNQSSEQSDDLPEDSTFIRQVDWAWFWASVPLIVVVGVLFYLGVIPDPLVSLVILLVIVVPKYLVWRRTAYILTKDTLIYQRGGITGYQRYRIPISGIKSAVARDGLFGRTLGYQAIDLKMDNDAVVSLTYITAVVDVASHIQGLMETDGSEADGVQDDNELSDESPSDSDESRNDTNSSN